VDERRAFALATIFDRASHYFERLDRIGAVALLQIERRKTLDETRHIAAGSLHFNRNADRIAVVFE